jgi:hypothetical protein
MGGDAVKLCVVCEERLPVSGATPGLCVRCVYDQIESKDDPVTWAARRARAAERRRWKRRLKRSERMMVIA